MRQLASTRTEANRSEGLFKFLTHRLHEITVVYFMPLSLFVFTVRVMNNMWPFFIPVCFGFKIAYFFMQILVLFLRFLKLNFKIIS